MFENVAQSVTGFHTDHISEGLICPAGLGTGSHLTALYTSVHCTDTHTKLISILVSTVQTGYTVHTQTGFAAGFPLYRLHTLYTHELDVQLDFNTY